jgi:hypothetical protein
VYFNPESKPHGALLKHEIKMLTEMLEWL